MTSLKSIAWQTKEAIFDSLKAIEDVIVSMVPQAATLLTGIVASALIARGIGASGVGQYALIVSISGFTVALSDLGIGQTAIRYASRAASQNDSESQFAVLRWAFRLRVSLSLVFSFTAFLLAPIIAGGVWHDAN